MFILLLTFLGNFEWDLVEGGNVSKEILESSIVRQFGKDRVRKSFIKLDADIFEGGCIVLVPKGYKIIEVPEGLKFIINYVEMEKYDRYSAIYESGRLEGEWNELKRELAEDIGGVHFGTPSLEALRKKLVPAGISDRENLLDAIQSEGPKEIEGPKKVYYSFLLVEKELQQKLIPVLLVLSPLDEIYKEIIKEIGEAEGGER